MFDSILGWKHSLLMVDAYYIYTCIVLMTTILAKVIVIIAIKVYNDTKYVKSQYVYNKNNNT